MMHLRPELVQLGEGESFSDLSDYLPDNADGIMICRDMAQRTKTGATGRPDLASPEKGEKMFEVIVRNVIAVIDKYLSEPLPERADFKSRS